MPSVTVIKNLIRLAVTAGLLWVLFVRTDIGQLAEILRSASLVYLSLVTALLAMIGGVVALRWHTIITMSGPSPNRMTLLKVTFVGLFFNQVFPAGTGGDAMRVWRCCILGMPLGASIRSVLIDRASGYAIVVLLYAAALPVLLRLVPNPAEQMMFGAVLAAAFAGGVALVSIDVLPHRIVATRLIAPIATLSRELRRVFHNPSRAGVIFGLSAVSIGLNVLSFALAGKSVDISLSILDWLTIVPPVMLIQLLPISLGGWGIREIALVYVLAAFGVPREPALAASVLVGMCQILAALPGGFIWLGGWDIAEAAAPRKLEAN